MKRSISRPFSVLMIIDHEFMRKTLGQWLFGQLTGLTIIEAGCGEDALDILRTKSPDLILMDIFLPDVSAVKILRQIKTLYPDTPVIFLTTHEDGVYQSLAENAGAD
ncbi:MAG: response regulator transcription factor, partial [Chloroflexi bacterium]|nr:response regulator transcription factor [Chloroflexota bacterium]